MKLRMPRRKVSLWRCDLTTTAGRHAGARRQDGRQVFLDRDMLLQRVVPGQVDDAEAAFADGPDDLVVEQPHALGQRVGGVAGAVGPVRHQRFVVRRVPVTGPGTVRVSSVITRAHGIQGAQIGRLPDFQVMHGTMRTSIAIMADPLSGADSTAR